MINFVVNNFAPNWIFKPMQENDYSLNHAKPSVCLMVEDKTPTTLNPSTWIKNSKYSCKTK